MRFSLKALTALALTTTTLVGCGAAGSPMGLGHYRTMSRFGGLGVSPYSLWVLPDQGDGPVLQAINSAQKSIQLEDYMFTLGGASGPVAQALIAKARAGVDVRVILDRAPYGGHNPNPATAQALQAGGVQCQTSSPAFTYTHEKSMVVDGQVAVVMTFNMTNAGVASNREYGVVDTNPQDVADISNVFVADWNRAPVTVSAPNLVVSPINSRAKILALIDSAQSSILLEDEELNDPIVAQHLGAKAKAGVNVRVEVANGTSNAATQQLLASNGVTQFETMTSHYLHAKAIVVDGNRAYVGSENMSSTSLDKNREMGLILTDPACVSTLASTLNQDWQTR